MRTAVNRYLVLVAIVASLVCTTLAKVDASSDLTITPAALTLGLKTGSSVQSTEFTIANNYPSPVTLRFAFEPKAGAANPANPADYLRLSQTLATIGPSATLQQTVTATDSPQLSPGSQQADLVITQTNTSQASNVGVLPSIRMPLIIIKEDGAVSAMTLARLSTPRFRLTMPHSLTASFHNSGNMIVIPRGFITIIGPGESAAGKGVLNTSSLAMAPGGNLNLSTPLSQLDQTSWPGIYQATVSYGLGGGQQATVASARFFYVAWWQIASLLTLGGTAYLIVKRVLKTRRIQNPARDPPKQALLIGRDIS